MSLISFIKSMLGASVDHTSVSPKNESSTQSSEEKTVNREPEKVKEEVFQDAASVAKEDSTIEQNAVSDTSAKSSCKMQVYNLIIVDESGSMSGLRDVTLSGINETINTIREAQKEYANVQEHFITLVTFDERNNRNVPAVRTVIDAKPIAEVADFSDYHPQGCTPLYDAMGESLSTLRKKISNNENATGVATILTDGLENASHHWRVNDLRKLIEQLKEEGWTFSYMTIAWYRLHRYAWYRYSAIVMIVLCNVSLHCFTINPIHEKNRKLVFLTTAIYEEFFV